MRFDVGDKVWIKSLEEIKEIAEEVKEEDGFERCMFPSIGYDFIPNMHKYCDSQVTIREYIGNDTYIIDEDDGEWKWCLCWLSKNKSTSMKYVSDFDGALEEMTPAEVYWEQVMPQIKEIVINTYNKGVEIGKAECL